MTDVTEQPAMPTGEAVAPAMHDSRTPGLGAIHISKQVVAKVAAYAATELPDVGGPSRGLARMPGGDMLGTGGADLHRRPKVTAHVDDGHAYLDLVVSVRWPASVPQVSATLREHVRERVQQLTGLQVGEIRIAVADLVTDTAPGARVR
jgi:uncharacterized alkaline shock family protein YloU